MFHSQIFNKYVKKIKNQPIFESRIDVTCSENFIDFDDTRHNYLFHHKRYPTYFPGET